AQPARGVRDVAPEQHDPAARGLELARDQIEERRLAGAVRADDQAPLALSDGETDVGGHGQAAERFLQLADLERRHDVLLPPQPRRAAAARARRARRMARHSRSMPGTSPSGMKRTIATKMAPSTRFQRSM